MVLGYQLKGYKHLMKNLMSSLIIHQRIQTTHAKAKHLAKATNKLIHFAKKADKGFTSPINLVKGRIYTQAVHKKLMMEIVPKLDNVQQNFVTIQRKIRHRRGDNAPMVYIRIKNTQKQEAVKQMKKQQQKKQKKKEFSINILNQQRQYFQQQMAKYPQKAQFFKKKIAQSDYHAWILTKKPGQKRLSML